VLSEGAGGLFWTVLIRHGPGLETGGLRFRSDALERFPVRPKLVAYGRSGSPILQPAYEYCSLRQKS
jgi:hypothetical protein